MKMNTMMESRGVTVLRILIGITLLLGAFSLALANDPAPTPNQDENSQQQPAPGDYDPYLGLFVPMLECIKANPSLIPREGDLPYITWKVICRVVMKRVENVEQ